MRNMSFALTTPQILARTKTVTRRTGWRDLKPGTLLQAIEKGQGLKKGEKVRPLAVIRVTDVRREPLALIDADDVAREGFQESTPAGFVAMFCATHRVVDALEFGTGKLLYRKCEPADEVTRIEFEYVDELAERRAARLAERD